MASTHAAPRPAPPFAPAAAPAGPTAPPAGTATFARGPVGADRVLDDLDAQVRARVRTDGVDPQREAVVVRRIAEEVVRAHDELSLTGAVAPVADDDVMVGDLVARIAGFGPLQPFLDDPEVEEV